MVTLLAKYTRMPWHILFVIVKGAYDIVTDDMLLIFVFESTQHSSGRGSLSNSICISQQGSMARGGAQLASAIFSLNR